MTLEARRDGAVAHLLLNRPEKANALDSALLEALAAAYASGAPAERVKKPPR